MRDAPAYSQTLHTGDLIPAHANLSEEPALAAAHGCALLLPMGPALPEQAANAMPDVAAQLQPAHGEDANLALVHAHASMADAPPCRTHAHGPAHQSHRMATGGKAPQAPVLSPRTPMDEGSDDEDADATSPRRKLPMRTSVSMRHNYGFTDEVIHCTGMLSVIMARTRARLWFPERGGRRGVAKLVPTFIHGGQYCYDWDLHADCLDTLQLPNQQSLIHCAMCVLSGLVVHCQAYDYPELDFPFWSMEMHVPFLGSHMTT